jgi:L-fucono-1,5-lactonase
MRIDSHQHFWRYDPVRDSWITDTMRVLRRDYLPGDLAPELARNGVHATITVQVEQSERETEFLLDLARKHSFIAGVVGWIDLRSPAVAERLRHFSQFDRLVGFRHIAQSEPDDFFLLGQEFVRGLRQLQPYGFTYDLLVYPRQLPAAVELVARLPQQAFVLDHIGKPEIRKGESAGWRGFIRELAARPNVHCKLSGVVTEAKWDQWTPEEIKPYLDTVLEEFGPGRLMFGSDWPVCLLAASYGQVTNLIRNYIAQCSPAEQEAILGGNAKRFYRIKAAEWT